MHNSWRRKTIAAALAAPLIAGVTFGTTAQADDQSPAIDVEQGVAAEAQRQGVSADELVESMLWQDELAKIATAIEAEYPADFTYASAATDSPVVAFKGTAPVDIQERLDPLPVEVAILSDVGWSEAEIVSFGESIHVEIFETIGESVATNIDSRAGEVTVTVPTDQEQRAVTVLSSSRRSMDFPLIVETVSAASFWGEDAIFGGQAMTNTCTSAFSVRTSSYANGMMTAAHCGNATSQGGVTLSFRGESSTRDVQWHSAGTVTDPLFYVASGSLRGVTSRANPVLDQTLCKYGRTTGATCDTTYIDNHCRGSYCDMMTMSNRRASGGDSGGPWYSNQTAYGVHSGYVTIWGSPRDMFTPINSALSALGLTLKTL